jgi:hypothetical protein
MPRGDRTGPWGQGPMTGRAAGYCAGYPVPGFMNPFPGRGLGLGGGRGGWGYRHWYYATGLPGWMRYGWAPAWGTPPAPGMPPYPQAPSPEEEAAALEQQVTWLKQHLQALEARLAALRKGEATEKGQDE